MLNQVVAYVALMLQKLDQAELSWEIFLENRLFFFSSSSSIFLLVSEFPQNFQHLLLVLCLFINLSSGKTGFGRLSGGFYYNRGSLPSTVSQYVDFKPTFTLYRLSAIQVK